ncbi:MAG: peptidoglycan DD-metalloendopeptidase family protein [Bacteroidales bacterium]|jgi:murein DD-endopeptidase MepM/ murein hydrolase activator NlpD|nr:peptidoglycan DD-metalloendopeptidase family protein [Bacteroidales bacterium]
MSKKALKKIIILLIIIILLTISLVVIHQIRYHGKDEIEIPVEEEQEVLWMPIIRYGIAVDTLDMREYQVQNGENISAILQRIGISPNIAEQIYANTKGVMDLKKIRAGNPYVILTTSDSLGAPLYLVYENTKIQYTVFELFEPYRVYQEENEVSFVTDTISGVITSSLWNAIIEDKSDPALAAELADVYQWTIDFFGIQKGDEFYAIYWKKFVNGNYIGLDNIQSALFKHGGKDYYAFYYQVDSSKKGEYYDEAGASLRRAFLKAPLNYTRISSKFSNNRYHPVLKRHRAHHGVDYAAPVGTPVYSIGSGKVIDKGYQKGGGGNYVKIKHNSIYTTLYMHLQGFAKGIAVGTHVSQGQLIGYVGSTGLSTGPHLDFRVYKNGSAIDPLKMDSPPADPVAKEQIPDYLQFINPVKETLQSLSGKTFLADAQFEEEITIEE